MILAQLNANQIPYDQLDWLQIGLYFLALPVVAFLGASLGLLGRWRRGGLLWSTNVGLLGGIVACLVCILAITTLEQKLPSAFVAYFEENYRWRMLFTALAATGASACLAGLAWRWSRAPRDQQPFSFSLSQLMGIQLFSFLSLGAWLGFRLYVLSSVSPGEYHYRALNAAITRWTSVGWDIPWNDRRRAEIDLCQMQPSEIADSLAMFNESNLQMLPDLKGVSMKFTTDSDLDLTPLIEHGHVQALSLQFGSISDRLLNQIGESEIESLTLFGDLSSRDLSVLSKMPKLKRLVLFGNNGRATINSLGNLATLKELVLYDSSLSGNERIPITWPGNLKELTIGSNQQTWDGSTQRLDISLLETLPKLKTLNLWGNYLMEREDVEFLKALSSLERLYLCIGSPSPPLIDAIAELPLNQNANGYLSLAIVDADFTAEEAARLKSIKRLHWLPLNLAEHGDEVLGEIAQIPSLARTEINSPSVTLDGLWKLADAPKLDWLNYPAALKSGDFEKDFRAKREAKNAPRLQIDGNQKPIARNLKATSQP